MAQDSKHTREISFDNEEIKALIEKRGKIVEQGLECAKEMERLAKEHQEVMEKNNDLMNEANTIKLDILEKTKVLAADQLTEYEAPVTTKIVDGRVHLVVTDLLEEYKDNFIDFDPWKQALPSKEE